MPPPPTQPICPSDGGPSGINPAGRSVVYLCGEINGWVGLRLGRGPEDDSDVEGDLFGGPEGSTHPGETGGVPDVDDKPPTTDGVK